MPHPFTFPPSPLLVEPDVYIPTFAPSKPIDLTNKPIDLTNFNDGLDESVFSGTLFYNLCALNAARHRSNPPKTLKPPPVLPPQNLSLQSVEYIFAELYEACATPPSDDPLGKPYVPWDSDDVADTPPPSPSSSPSPLVPPRTKKRQKRDASADLPSAAAAAGATVSDTPSSSPSPLVPPRQRKRQKTAHLSSAAAPAGVTVSSVEQENVHAHSYRDCDTCTSPASEASPRTARPLATLMPQPQSTTASAWPEGTTAEALSPTPRKRKTQSGTESARPTKKAQEFTLEELLELDDIQFKHWLNSLKDGN